MKYLLIGIILGMILSIIYNIIKSYFNKPLGVIEVDIQSNLCKFRITSGKLSDKHTKKAVFIVKHDIDLSREEHIL